MNIFSDDDKKSINVPLKRLKQSMKTVKAQEIKKKFKQLCFKFNLRRKKNKNKIFVPSNIIICMFFFAFIYLVLAFIQLYDV